VETLAEYEIRFPKSPKKAKDQAVLFNKFLSLIEESEESLPIKVKPKKRRRQAVLDSDEFMFAVSFRKPLLIKILVNDPEKNIAIVNEVGNKVLNYMNTILGEEATNAKIILSKTIVYPQKTINLCKKMIGDQRLAKITEEVKQPMNVMGIVLGYELNGKKLRFANIANDRNIEVLRCISTYKGKIPFNVLRKQYDELANLEEIVKKLTEMEL